MVWCLDLVYRRPSELWCSQVFQFKDVAHRARDQVYQDVATSLTPLTHDDACIHPIRLRDMRPAGATPGAGGAG